MGFKNVVRILNDIQLFLWNFGDIIWELFKKNYSFVEKSIFFHLLSYRILIYI